MYDDDEITPRKVSREIHRWTPTILQGAIAATVVVLVVVFIGWQVGGWFQVHTAERNAKIAQINTQTQQNGIGYQEGQESNLQQQIANVAAVTVEMDGASGTMYQDLSAQRLADGKIACTAAAQITSIPAQEQGWVAQNCANGVLSPTSPLYK
jgi:hypothetical protein